MEGSYMGGSQELIFLHQVSAPCHLATLAQSIGMKVRVVNQVSDLLALKGESNCFCLVSQQGAALDSKGVPVLVSKLVNAMPVALYQVDRKSLEPESALLLGIRGLLYTDQSMDLLLTGLKKMMNEELWYDRPLISKMLKRLIKQEDTELDDNSDETIAMLQMLTNREKTIIQLVSSGARNKEIAYRLCISEHTVKAHISSIFRKTQSRNRVELLRWSQSYQPHFQM